MSPPWRLLLSIIAFTAFGSYHFHDCSTVVLIGLVQESWVSYLRLSLHQVLLRRTINMSFRLTCFSILPRLWSLPTYGVVRVLEIGFYCSLCVISEILLHAGHGSSQVCEVYKVQVIRSTQRWTFLRNYTVPPMVVL